MTKDGIGCPLTGLETRTDGTYTGSLIATATSKGSPVGLTVNDAWKCTTATFTGQLSGKANALTLHPTYAGCKAFGLTSTVTTTGCDYVIHTNGTMDIECTEGSIIKVATATCEIQITPQTGLSKVNLTDDAGSPAYVTINPQITSIAYHVTKDGIGCPQTKVETRTDGSIQGVIAARVTVAAIPTGFTAG